MTEDASLPPAHPHNAEIELLKQQDEHQFQLATHQIDVNHADRCVDREHFSKLQEKNNQRAFIAFLVLIFLFFGFGAFAIWLGKEALLSDLLKVFVGAFGGGGIGYYLGFRHKQQQ